MNPDNSDDPPPRSPGGAGRFGGIIELPAAAPASGWRIDRARATNFANPEEIQQWLSWRKAVIDKARQLIQARILNPTLPWHTQEVVDRERSYRDLLVLEDSFARLFEDDPFVQLQRVWGFIDQTKILAQLRLAYEVQGHHAASAHQLKLAFAALRQSEFLLGNLQRTKFRRALLKIFPWLVDASPSRQALDATAAELRRARSNLDGSPLTSPAPLKGASPVVLMIENAVGEVAGSWKLLRFDKGPMALYRKYSQALATLYALQGRLRTVGVTPRYFAYLKTLEAWLAFAVASSLLACGDAQQSRYFGSEASDALEMALVPTGVRRRFTQEVLDGIHPPDWREIQVAQEHLQEALSDLRRRLSMFKD